MELEIGVLVVGLQKKNIFLNNLILILLCQPYHTFIKQYHTIPILNIPFSHKQSP